ncbi:MAG TPA: LytTR family transcriptional regulator DNA-binding domain-containing protein [Bacteroidales bacterium]|nr:LytTR family transcriptional regulator DNA-binding domain-containing protein [Bacteroidales bacterium]
MEKIKTIIIDDEELARNIIEKFLESYEDVEIVAVCTNGFEGVKSINDLQPDLVFLDVQMPKLNGFEVVELIDPSPVIIFATAFDEYAIKAFEMNAVDYLLKPFSKERFGQAIEKARVRIMSKENNSSALKKLSETIHEKSIFLDRIVVRAGSKIKVISVGTIKYLEAQDDYVMIYTTDGKFLKQQTMKFFEQHLDPDKYLRVHRSYIANIELINQIEPYEKENYIAKLVDGSKVKVSANGYKRLREKLRF